MSDKQSNMSSYVYILLQTVTELKRCTGMQMYYDRSTTMNTEGLIGYLPPQPIETAAEEQTQEYEEGKDGDHNQNNHC